jgi:hypothetical protein
MPVVIVHSRYNEQQRRYGVRRHAAPKADHNFRSRTRAPSLRFVYQRCYARLRLAALEFT